MSIILSLILYSHDFTVYYRMNEVAEENRILFFDDLPDRPPDASPS